MSIASYRPEKPKDPLIWIVISILIASVFTIYPLSYDISAWRPFILLMVMLFWVLCQPTWCGVWFAFGVGVFTDLLLDASLGKNALIFVLITFISRYFIRERRILTFMNIWVITILAIIAYALYLWVSQVLAGENYPIMRRWPPLLSSILLWPLLYYSLRKWRN
ncbi:MAG: rod shape-determining protein MreD [Acinetobacter sp.]